MLSFVFAAAVFSGCATEKPQYELALLYEAAPGASIGSGFSHEIQLPAFSQPFCVLNQVQFSDLHVADVVAVHATLTTSPEGKPAYDLEAIPPPRKASQASAVATEKPKPEASSTSASASKADALAAVATAKPVTAKNGDIDFRFPALLVRLTPAASRKFLSDTMNPALTGRRVFLHVNGQVVGVYRITGPVRGGELLFNHQFVGVAPENIDRVLYDLAHDVNRSIVIRKKEAENK